MLDFLSNLWSDHTYFLTNPPYFNMKKALFITSIAVLFAVHSKTIAQSLCSMQIPTPPPVPCGEGVPLIVDNTTISIGDTFYHDGSNISLANTTIDGGTLVICDTIVFNGFSFYSGNLIITSTGYATFNSYYNSSGGTDHHYYNYGSTVYNLPMTINGSGRFVFNAIGAHLTVNGDCIVAGGLMVNEGDIIINGELRFEGAGEACLGPGSSATAETVSNDHLNAISVPEGTACIAYSDDFWGNQQITQDTGLFICQQPGALAPGTHSYAGVAGNATVISNCTDCSVPLPLTLLSFSAVVKGAEILLEWKTADEYNLLSFIIEKSNDALHFEKIGKVMAHNESYTYRYTTKPDAPLSFFRLKIIDQDGSWEYSKIAMVSAYSAENTIWTVYPNPVPPYINPAVCITVPTTQTFKIVFADILGNVMYNRKHLLEKGTNRIAITIIERVSGIYILSIYDKDNNLIATPNKILLE